MNKKIAALFRAAKRSEGYFSKNIIITSTAGHTFKLVQDSNLVG